MLRWPTLLPRVLERTSTEVPAELFGKGTFLFLKKCILNSIETNINIFFSSSVLPMYLTTVPQRGFVSSPETNISRQVDAEEGPRGCHCANEASRIRNWGCVVPGWSQWPPIHPPSASQDLDVSVCKFSISYTTYA